MAKIEPIDPDEVLSYAVHEMSSPVTNILGALQSLGSVRSDGRREEFMQMIERNARRLNYHLSMIGWYRRLEHHQGLPLDLEEADIRDVTDGAIQLVENRAHDKGMGIKNQVENSKLYVDVGMIDQVMINLLSNAVKYGTEGSEIYVGSEDADDEHLKVLVSNTGEPVPEEYRSRLFQKFTQADHVSDGLGLGLYICDRVVKRHGGRMHYHVQDESDDDKPVTNVFDFTISRALEPGYTE